MNLDRFGRQASSVAPLLLLASTLLTACATVQSGGFAVTKGALEEASFEIKSRAVYELRCPEQHLDLRVLAIHESGWGNSPTQIGVSGCGHVAVYVKTGSGWVMNNEILRRR